MQQSHHLSESQLVTQQVTNCDFSLTTSIINSLSRLVIICSTNPLIIIIIIIIDSSVVFMCNREDQSLTGGSCVARQSCRAVRRSGSERSGCCGCIQCLVHAHRSHNHRGPTEWQMNRAESASRKNMEAFTQTHHIVICHLPCFV